MNLKMSKKSNKPQILLVEDDRGFRELLEEELREAGYAIVPAGSLSSAKKALTHAQPDIILTDLKLPDGRGTELLEITRKDPLPPAFLVLTAFGTIPQAVEALKQGADHFLTKPVDFDHLRIGLEKALELRHLKVRLMELDQKKLPEGEGFHGILGESPAMQKLFYQIRQIAPVDDPVVVTGESGTGKEKVARALHEESNRAKGPFLPLNCAGLTRELIESELFGHTEGAFTGARKARKGLFAAADGGTLFLDEIAELPTDLQARLLRAIQERSVRSLGANVEQRVDVRVIAATHRNLETEVAEGRFREDLYFRLETFHIVVPPLRQRAGDLDLLANDLIHKYAKECGKKMQGISAEALQVLRQYPFPGNVRELQNLLKRAVLFAENDSEVGAELLPDRLQENAPSSIEWAATNSSFEDEVGFSLDGKIIPLKDMRKRYVNHVLAQVEGNKRRAAALLGIGRRTLYSYLEG